MRRELPDRFELDAGDRSQVAGSAVQQHLDVREGLEAAAEARLRLPDTLRERPDPAAGQRVEMQDAVGLREPERAQDDCLGLVGASHKKSL